MKTNELTNYLSELSKTKETFIKSDTTDNITVAKNVSMKILWPFKYNNCVYYIYRNSPGDFQWHEFSDNIRPITQSEWLEKLNLAANETKFELELNFEPYFEKNSTSNQIGNGYNNLLTLITEKIKHDPELIYTLLAEKNKNNIFFKNITNLKDLKSELENAQNSNKLGTFFTSVKNSDNNISTLLNLINNPSLDSLEYFLDYFPLVTNVLLLSVHGWFAQKDVLGKPDTGGQVVYILDQVKAIESCLTQMLENTGVVPQIIIGTRLIPDAENTSCNIETENVQNTEHCKIMRVPFKSNEKLVNNWVSRFKIWPYLESFCDDFITTLKTQDFEPDYIAGNYSDGNFAAFLLNRHFKNSVNSSVAHALEKSKYEFAEVKWRELEEEYSFSKQFIADLIAMNNSDFVISSTQQEISGTTEKPGQYESHLCFALPGLAKIENGVDIHSNRFNILPPGVDNNYFYPSKGVLNQKVEELLFESSSQFTKGSFAEPEKPVLFSMARLDKIKNITGLVQSYKDSKVLQEKYNLLLIAGKLSTERTNDAEEKHQIDQMHKLIDSNNLDNKVRWLELNLDKVETGDVYRIIASRNGVFVQPALYEAFGLTILEAMSSNLPVIATQYGGPSEIITENKSGFFIDVKSPEKFTSQLEEAALKLLNVQLYETITAEALKKVQSIYNWKNHAKKQLKMAALYRLATLSNKANHNARKSYCNLVKKSFF